MKINRDTTKEALMKAMLNNLDSIPNMSVYYPETRILFGCNSDYPYWLDRVCNIDKKVSEKGFEKVKGINRK